MRGSLLIVGAEPATASNGTASDRRSQIIGAATRLLVQKPHDEISIRDLERESGITRGGIYYYFESKEEIFSEVVHEGLMILHADMSEAVRGDHTPTEKIRRVMAVMRSQYDDHRARFDVLIRFWFGAEPTVQVNDQLLASVHEIIGETTAMVVGVIDEGVQAGEFRCEDPAFEAMAIWGTAVTVIQMHNGNRRFSTVSRDQDQLYADLVDHVLRSLRNGAPPA